jgi:hypothetical protein
MEKDWGLTAGNGCRWPAAEEERLDRPLVAGMMLDAALGSPPCSPEPQDGGQALKIRVQDALLSLFAGRVSLDRFRSLMATLDHFFPFYFPLVSSLAPRPAPATGAPQTPPGPGSLLPPPSRAVDTGELAAAVSRVREALPQRPRSKMNGEKLLAFLERTRGCWFRLAEFQGHFGMDRKTAWEYAQKFLQAGLLTRNSGRAAAVRYALEDRFLRVRGQAVREGAAAALSGLPPQLVSLAGDRLIASGGEPFWEQEWRGLLPAASLQAIINCLLESAALVEVVSRQDAKDRLLRLKSCWLKSPVAAT